MNSEPSKYSWIDSHCHLTDERFADDLDSVLSRARDAGIGHMVVIGDPTDSSRSATALAAKHSFLSVAMGVHPHNAAKWSEQIASELRKLLKESNAVALGETGLDFFYDFSPRDAQLEAFLCQVEIAREMNLPLVIHCRNAYDEFIKLADKHNIAAIGGVIHCFGGTAEEAKKLVAMGFMIGIAGPLTFKKNQQMCDVVRAVGLKSLLIETDAPYLAPEPMRGRRNEPSFVVHTGRRLAHEIGVSEEAVAKQTTENAARLYRLC